MAIADLIYIDATGLHLPDYPAVLDELKAGYRLIYGADTYLESDSQDGQWVAINALAIFDTMQVAQVIYNAFSPLTSQGDALSRMVKINGLRRLIPSYSGVDLLVIGQVGTTIINGQAEDLLGQKWILPASVVIPIGGAITVTATAAIIGAVSAAPNTINKIATPFNGWQTVNNPAGAAEGSPTEPDATLRQRQTVSTALPSLSVLDGTIGAVAAVPAVTRYRAYENDTNIVDANGLPAHSIALVVEGGLAQTIGEAISRKKTPGTTTHGTTSVVVYDIYGIPNTINFFRPTSATIGVELTIEALEGYTSGYADLIAESLSMYINALKIGDDVLITRLYVPATLAGVPGSTYDITLLRIKKNAGAFGLVNLAINFDEVALCDASVGVTVIVV